MRNCLILGSGRSGTSMLAGILHQAGYFLGDKLYPGRESNPRGFFEWGKINRINEDILSPYDRKGLYALFYEKIIKQHTVFSPGKNQHWLLALPDKTAVSSHDPAIIKQIGQVVRREPFCYKDPRFCYTLPVWKAYLKPDTAFICVFREPGITVESILKECSTQDYLKDLHIDRRSAYRAWLCLHTHLLTRNTDGWDNFFFVHYNQVYDGSAIEPLSRFLGVKLDAGFVDQALKRTMSRHQPPARVMTIYRRLCGLAHYRETQ